MICGTFSNDRADCVSNRNPINESSKHIPRSRRTVLSFSAKLWTSKIVSSEMSIETVFCHLHRAVIYKLGLSSKLQTSIYV